MSSDDLLLVSWRANYNIMRFHKKSSRTLCVVVSVGFAANICFLAIFIIMTEASQQAQWAWKTETEF